MMTPVYFPFTTISEPVFGALAACFDRVALYHPYRQHLPETLHGFKNQGRLEIRLPSEKECRAMAELLKTYRQWADLHHGERPDFEKFHPSRIPFYNDATPSRIRSDIQAVARENDPPPTDGPEPPSSLLKAGLFLILAQEYDQHRISLLEDLEKIDHMGKSLFRDLTSEPETSFHAFPGDFADTSGGTSDHMADERLAAWGLLYTYLKEAAARVSPTAENPELFITSEPSVLDSILGQTTDSECILRVSGIPCHGGMDTPAGSAISGRLNDTLRQAICAPLQSSAETITFPDAGTGETAVLSVYRAGGNFISEHCARSASFPIPRKKLQSVTEKPYALVSLLTPGA